MAMFHFIHFFRKCEFGKIPFRCKLNQISAQSLVERMEEGGESHAGHPDQEEQDKKCSNII